MNSEAIMTTSQIVGVAVGAAVGAAAIVGGSVWVYQQVAKKALSRTVNAVVGEKLSIAAPSRVNYASFRNSIYGNHVD